MRELWAIIARRGGKSRMAAAIGCYLACFLPRRLAAGETGEVTIISASREQASVVFRYVLGFLRASPVLRQEIESTTATEVRLRGNVVLSTRAGNYRTVRGRTLLAGVIDEVAFLRDETSATPDIEVYRALLPALATTGGMLIGISTPYARRGLLYQKHRDYYGVAGPDVLVVSGNAPRFNPTIDVSAIERARESDPEAARSEWDAQFRDDLSSFLDDASIDAAVEHGRPLELLPREGVVYFCFVDMGGGRHDPSAIAIVHIEGEGDGRRYVADVVRGRKGDPAAAVREFVELARQYRCSTITGDNYAAEWVAGAFREAGCEYRQSKLVRSELYLAGLPLFTRGIIAIPNLAHLLRELRLLERRTARSGKDSVDHGVGGSDDHANALFGALHLAASAAMAQKVPIPRGPFIIGGTPRGYPGSSPAYGEVICPTFTGINPLPAPAAPAEPAPAATMTKEQRAERVAALKETIPPNYDRVVNGLHPADRELARLAAEERDANAPAPRPTAFVTDTRPRDAGSASARQNSGANESFFWGGQRGREW